jgi:putative ABC transport system permease protein
MDPDLPMANLRTMEQIVARSTAAPRFRTSLIATFASLALILAAIGIYGVVSYSVAQRSRELAIRAALGARSAGLLRMVLREALTPVSIGLAIGLVAALALARVLTSLLFGVTTTDTPVYIAVPAMLLGVATLATLAPALRATRADPMHTLRES